MKIKVKVKVTEGKIKGGTEVTERRGIRRRKLLDDLKERREYSYLKEEALDHTVWRARFGRCFGPVVDRLLNEGMICIVFFYFRSSELFYCRHLSPCTTMLKAK
jgi:hypothetical protein